MADDNQVVLDAEQKNKLPELAEAIATLEKIVQKQHQDTLDRDKMDKLMAKVTELNQQISSKTRERLGEFSTREAEEVLEDHNKNFSGRTKAIDVICAEPSKDENILAVQKAVDRSYILSTLMKKPVQELKYFQNSLKTIPLLQKTLISTDVGNTGVGAALTGWQPAQFSARMIELVRLALTVSNIHPRINMPADPFRFPIEGGDATAYYVPEQGDTDAEVTEAKKVPIGFTTTGADHLVMASKKIGARVVLSQELVEDSYIAILDYIEQKLALAMANASDNVMVNGDPSPGVSFDLGNGWGAGDQRRMWKGYRKTVQGKTSNVAVSAGGLDIADIRKVRQYMGKFAMAQTGNPVVMFCGPIGYIKLLALKDGSNPSPVLTIDKYGPAATILTGEMAKVDGIPIILTDFIGPNLPGLAGNENLNSLGLYDGSTTGYTELLFVQPSSFLFGDRRQQSLRVREVPDTDQQVLITLSRLTCLNLRPNENTVGAIYGIAK